jgi:hypothetical protein
MVEQTGESKRFEPKVAVQLDPPKDDLISVEELAKCDGMRVYPSQIRTPPIPDFQSAQLKECH